MLNYRNAEYYPDPTPYEALKEEIHRGDIWMMHTTVNTKTGEKSADKKPVVIISNDEINSKAGFIVYVVIDDCRYTADSNVPISRDGIRGYAVCGKINTAGKNKLAELVSVCYEDELAAIEAALFATLGFRDPEPAETAAPVTKPTPPPEPVVIIKDDPEKDAKIIRLETEKEMFEKLYKELLQSMLKK